MAAAKVKSVKVRYKVRSFGIKPGDEHDVSPEQAAELVAHGHATVVPPTSEKAKKA